MVSCGQTMLGFDDAVSGDFVKRFSTRTGVNARLVYGSVRRFLCLCEGRGIGAFWYWWRPMNRKSFTAGGLAALILGWSTTLVFAQQLGTAADARVMLDRAIVALKSNERTALSAFNDQNDKRFHDRDLYVFCFNMSDGKVTSYSAPFLIGADVRTLTLVNDPIGQRAYDTVRNATEGKIAVLQYKMPKPGTIEPATKLSVETRIGNQGCGVTYYE